MTEKEQYDPWLTATVVTGESSSGDSLRQDVRTAQRYYR